MRIALDATYSVDPYPSGIAVYSREIICGLAAGYPKDQYFPCFRLKQFRGSTRFLFRNAQRRLLLPPFKTFNADIFHALNQRVDRRPARRVVTTFHDLFVMTGEYSSPEFRIRFSEQARVAASNSDRIIAVSEFTARQVHEWLGVERGRIQVVPHGVHQPVVASASQRQKIVLCVGALQIRKNISRLVKAFESIAPEWTLVLAGSPGGYRAAEILQTIDESTARSRIRVTGYITPAELQQLYSQASIFAFPSMAEGFGMPVIEAMANEVPVLTSRGSACEEVAGDCALLVDPAETEEIAGALLRLSREEELRKELVRRGLEHVRTYTWERAIRATHQVYEELVR